MSSSTNAFAQRIVVGVGYAMISITSAVILARAGLQLFRPRKLTASDYFVVLAFIVSTTMCVLNIAVSPYMTRVYGVSDGLLPPYADLKHDMTILLRLNFAAQCSFWTTLWLVKYSLLLLYRKLLIGILRNYTIIWWAIVVICILTHLGNYFFYFRACGTFITGFFHGSCVGPKPYQAQLVSLYYSYTADTSTNIMIMALPMHLAWNLQMARRKIAILLLFASGVVCILMATIRAAQVAVNATKSEKKMLDPTWLALWSMVECSIAIIIGCCPAFAVLINAARNQNSSYNAPACYGTENAAHRSVPLNTLRSMASHTKNQQPDSKSADEHWVNVNSSQEQLATWHDGIMVSRTVEQTEDMVTMVGTCEDQDQPHYPNPIYNAQRYKAF